MELHLDIACQNLSQLNELCSMRALAVSASVKNPAVSSADAAVELFFDWERQRLVVVELLAFSTTMVKSTTLF